jgi:type II secretory pathway component GspD/PulD (secretin)
MVKLRSGEAAIIGGMIVTTDGKQTNSIPMLSKIPYLGKAFQTEATVSRKSEIVIILTATSKSHGNLPAPVAKQEQPKASVVPPAATQTAQRI